MSAKSKFPRALGITRPNENPPKTHLQLPETPQTTNTMFETLSIDESATTSTSSQTKLNQPQETGLFVTLKRRMKRLFGFTNDTSTLHKSLQNLTLTREEYDKRKSCSTENNIKAFAMRHVKRDYITNDVPEDVSSLKKEYEFAMIQLTSMTDPQILEVRKSWGFLKVHIEKIGVIMFLGLFEEHSDFRDAFAKFRGKQLMELTRDPTLQAHGLRVLNIVDKLVTRMHKVELIQDFILSLGSKHCRYVPSLSLIPCVQEQMIEAIKPVLEEQGMWTPDLEIGWRNIMTYLTCAMRYGLARTPRE